MQRLAETFHGKLRSQRFRSQLLNRAGVECEPSKITRILEHETIPAQVQNDGGCICCRRECRGQNMQPSFWPQALNRAGVECEPSKITRILEHETIPAQVQN